MARITIQDEQRTIDDPQAVAGYLAPFGIFYERWDTGAPRVSPDASAEEILAAYAPEIDALKARGGYVTADVINVTPETPGLDAMLNKFNKEHTHTEDEVRFIVKGRGVFHFHFAGAPVFGLEVEAGDLINVPNGTRHWFDLCADRTIRAIRLFQDKGGWTPHYVDGGVHAGYLPVCWGPNHLAAEGPKIAPVVKV
jgi:1,2-dihydroxy-3-keto-5-methylthiopentene dioxygenase